MYVCVCVCVCVCVRVCVCVQKFQMETNKQTEVFENFCISVLTIIRLQVPKSFCFCANICCLFLS